MMCLKPGSLNNGSSPASADKLANVAQSVEHIHGKDEVTSSILVIGSIKRMCR